MMLQIWRLHLGRILPPNVSWGSALVLLPATLLSLGTWGARDVARAVCCAVARRLDHRMFGGCPLARRPR